MVRLLMVLLVACMAGSGAWAAFAPSPKEAVDALLVTKGVKCRTGFVFVDGKYVKPPYVVKRYGTVLKINDVQVTGQLIPWERFLRTQQGLTVTTGAAEAKAPVQTASVPAEEDDPLADLFDDIPKKKPANAGTKRAAARPEIVLPDGFKFVANEESRKLVNKINKERDAVNAQLARGDFIFFGQGYSRVFGDAREAKRLLSKLPQMLMSSTSVESLRAAVRAGGFLYLSEPIIEDLFANRNQYHSLRSRYETEFIGIDDILMGGTRP